MITVVELNRTCEEEKYSTIAGRTRNCKVIFTSFGYIYCNEGNIFVRANDISLCHFRTANNVYY